MCPGRSNPMRPLLAALALVAMAAAPALAAGTTALEFLKLGVGARAAGMGEAFVSVADDASASYWNPAGVSGRSGQEVLFNHVEWFQDIRLENASYVWGNETQGIGISATVLHVGNLEERDASGTYLGDFRFFDNAIGLSYSRQIVPSIRVGVTGKFLREQIDRESAQTSALDAGVLVEIPATGFTLGASLANVGGGLKFIDQTDDLPTSFTVGGSYRVPGVLPYVGGSTLAMDVRKTRDADTSVRFGAEVGIAGIARYRVGYTTGIDGQDFGTGFGVNFERYRLDYAFVPSSFDLGDTHRFSLSLDF
jgi:hypothetical protein